MVDDRVAGHLQRLLSDAMFTIASLAAERDTLQQELGSMKQDTMQAIGSVMGGAAAQDMPKSPYVVIPGDAAIPITQSGRYLLTKGSAAAISVALPTVQGVDVEIISDSAFAHVITFTGTGMRGGTAAVATCTLAAQKGAGCSFSSLMPTEAAWGITANVAGTLA